MNYQNRSGVVLDISTTGGGERQTLLLLTYMAINPHAVLLLDEPDAHLEILRQREMYEILSQEAAKTNSQVIIASHSEVILNEAAERDMIIAFVGKPHRINDRGSQVFKALRDIRFEEYYLAEEKGWILYLEGSTDLSILRKIASRLNHKAREILERPFVHYLNCNQPNKAKEHFYALREAEPNLKGIAIYDRLDRELVTDPFLVQITWSKREIENYLCQKETLIKFAEERGKKIGGEMWTSMWKEKMEEALKEVESALRTLGKNPWDENIKASDEFLTPLFQSFYNKLQWPNEMTKTNFHELADYIPIDKIDQEISNVLDKIYEVATSVSSRS